jgi:type IV secretion system protein VirD4
MRFLWRWLPGYPATFQLSATLGLVSCIFPLLLLLTSSPPKKTPAVWATVKTLKRAKLLRKTGFRIGAYQGRIVRTAKIGHILIAATTQSMKTTGAVIPSLLDGLDDYTIFVHDPKEPGEIYDATAGYRSTFSKVIKFQPLSPTSHQINPLDFIRIGTEYETRDLQICADMLIDPDGELSKKANEGSIHFTQIAGDFCRGLIAYLLYMMPGSTLEDLYVILCGGGDIGEFVTKKMLPMNHPAVQLAAALYLETADRELSAFKNTARRALRLWADPLVCRATERSDFTLADIREGPQPLSLYMSFPFADQDRLRPLSRLIMRTLLEHAAYRKDRLGEKRYPVFAVLDEFQALGHFPIISYGLDYFLGMGVTMCLVTPSMNRVNQIWGKDHPFLEGTATRVVFGMRQKRIAESFTENIGTYPMPFTRTSHGKHSDSTSTEERDEPLFSAQELTQLDPMKLLAMIETQHVLLDKTPFFLDKKLLARSQMEVQP